MARKAKTSPLAREPRVAYGKVERAAHGAHSDVQAVLAFQPQRLRGLCGVLVQAAAGLPTGAMAPTDKARLRPLEDSLPLTGLRSMAVLLDTCGGALGANLPKAAEVDGLCDVLLSYESLRGQAARGAELCGGLRGMLSALAWFHLNTALAVTREKIADPQTPREEAQLYRDKMAGLLAHKEAVLQAQVEGRTAARETRERDAAAAETRRKQALVLDVATAIKNNWPLDRASLVEAARYFQELGNQT